MWSHHVHFLLLHPTLTSSASSCPGPPAPSSCPGPPAPEAQDTSAIDMCHRYLCHFRYVSLFCVLRRYVLCRFLLCRYVANEFQKGQHKAMCFTHSDMLQNIDLCVIDICVTFAMCHYVVCCIAMCYVDLCCVAMLRMNFRQDNTNSE